MSRNQGREMSIPLGHVEIFTGHQWLESLALDIDIVQKKKKENVQEERQKNKAWDFEEIPRLIKVQKTKVAKEQH